MATPNAEQKGGTETAIPRSLMDRLIGTLAGMRAGFNGEYFPPGKPLSAQAPEGVKGRQFDYPFSANVNYTPRGSASVSFGTLRRVADPGQGGLDILRLAIETRKDQMVTQKWKVRGRDPLDDGGKVARDLEIAFRRPDGALDFQAWMRMLLEDHFVIDAAALYLRTTSGGQTLFEQMDGATLNLLIDDRGRTPVPPLPAYQQILKGIPANDYTTKELAYYAANRRSDRIYGMSRVEQVLGIVTIALNRQLSVLSYYTQGNIPEMLIGVPESWTVDQITQYQNFWDAMLQGNVQGRRGARFVPGSVKPIELKDQVLKNEFDEWLARVVCYAFSLSPESLVKQTNRATAETAKEASEEQGLEPTKIWFKSVMDDLLLRINLPQLEWLWVDEEIQDPITKATVIQAYTGSRPIMGLDEARAMANLKPATPEVRAQLDPLWQQAVAPADPGEDDEGEDDDEDDLSDDIGDDEDNPGAGKTAKKRRRGSLQPPKRNRKLERKVERAVARLAQEALAAQRDALLAVIADRDRHRELVHVAAITTVDTMTKAVATDDDLRAMLRALDEGDWTDEAREQLRDLLADMASDRARAAANQIARATPGVERDLAQMVNQANDKAVAWAQARVGNLITEVTDATRNAVNELTANAISEGLTNDELATRISEGFEFSQARAERIARTETAEADVQGTLTGFRESGVVTGKEWSADASACDFCAALDGTVVGLDELFDHDGDLIDGPPAHPNCRCSILPVLTD